MRYAAVVMIAVVVLVGSAVPSLAGDVSYSPLPVYPGAKVDVEVNYSDKDFLPAMLEGIKLIPMLVPVAFTRVSGPPSEDGSNQQMPAGMQLGIQAIFNEENINEFSTAIADLKHVSLVTYKVPKEGKGEAIADFYMQKLGLTKGWERSVRADQPRGIFRLYVKPDLEGIFGLVVDRNQVIAFRTEGKVDLVALTRLTGKLMPVFISIGMQETSQKAEPSVQLETPPAEEETTAPQ